MINTGAEPYGYAFNNNLRDGLFHNGISPVIQNDGTVVAKFEDVLGNTADNSVNVATTAWVQKFVAEATRIKVGDLYFSTDGTNPTIRLGYGTWEKYAKGHAIVGHHDDTSSNTPDWLKTGGNTYGSYNHVLSVNELPNHSHTAYQSGDANNVVSPSSGLNISGTTNGFTGTVAAAGSIAGTGSNWAHNNVQPSIVVFVWKRTS